MVVSHLTKLQKECINFIREFDQYILPERKIVGLCIITILMVAALMILPEAKIAGFVAIISAAIAAIFRATK